MIYMDENRPGKEDDSEDQVDNQIAYTCGRLNRAIQEMGLEDRVNYLKLCRFLLDCTEEKRGQILEQICALTEEN